MLQGGGVSSTLSIGQFDSRYQQLPDQYWDWVFFNGTATSGNGGVREHWVVPLDFATDFGLGPTDVVTGVHVQFEPTAGTPDFAGVHITDSAVIIPEPSRLLLGSLGLLGILSRRRRAIPV